MMQSVATVLIVLCGLVGSSHAKQNQCSVGKVSCPNDSTCCALTNRSIGCCPIQNAVCCGDSVNCCPDGYTCDVIKGICKMGRKSMPPSNKIPAEPIMKVPATIKSVSHSASDGTTCPDKKYQCPKENTCCKLSSGIYGCCPSQNAVCCSDHKHCCPERYTCDLEAGKCKKRAEHIKLKMIEKNQAIKTSLAGECIKGFQAKVFLQKISALKTKISAALKPPYNRICPDLQTLCYNTETCCRTSSGRYRCCPLRRAVCCRGGRTCCPPGQICNMVRRTCDLAFDRPSNDPACPEKNYQFPKESFCCKLPSGTYGCCPLENAVKCSDHKHCCPEGYTCDAEAGKCKKRAERINMIEKSQAIKTPRAGEYIEGFQTKPVLKKTSAFKTKISAAVDLPPVICPDGSQCLPRRTCCRLPGGGFRCCPVPHTVGCSVGLHLCPAGYNCNATSLICFRGSQNIAMFQKATATKKRICPDRRTECLFSETCCRGRGGGYVCCPHPKAVCCRDGIHCCKRGEICVLGGAKCRRPIPRMTLFKKVPANQCPKESFRFKLPYGTYGCCPLKNAVCCSDHKHCCCDLKAGAELKYIHCPDGCLCFDNETCCELANEHFGCCPSSKAVCCSDHEHCCPAGFRCDLTALICVTGNVHLPMLKKAKSSRRPKTQQPNLDEKIHFFPAQTHGGDPVTDDKLGRKSLKSDDNQT